MADYIGAIDQGTTSTRFIIFDRGGAIVACAQKEHQQIYPQPGWVEHDPEEIWCRTGQVVAEAMRQSGLGPGDLAAIGITNQRETTVVWDRRTGRPVANALVWQDTRVAEAMSRSSRARAARSLPRQNRPSAGHLFQRPQDPLDSGITSRRRGSRPKRASCCSATSTRIWSGISPAARAAAFTSPIVTNASRTQLMNLATLDWDPEMLQRVRDSARHAARDPLQQRSLRRGHASMRSQGVPIAGILGDQQAALVGQACFSPGEAKNTYGTGCFLLMNTGRRAVPSKCGLLTTVALPDRRRSRPATRWRAASPLPARWCSGCATTSGSSAPAPEIEALARTVEDNGGVYFVPAFSGLYAPYWKHNARGVIAGLTRYANKGHMARAALEATAFQTRDVLEAMETGFGSPAGRAPGRRRHGGERPAHAVSGRYPGPRRGAAGGQGNHGAGRGVRRRLGGGVLPGLDDLRSRWSVDRTWKPAMDPAVRARMYGFWKKAVTRSFDWLEPE